MLLQTSEKYPELFPNNKNFLYITTKTSDLLLLDNGILFSLGQREEGRKGIEDSWDKIPNKVQFSCTQFLPEAWNTLSQME